MKPTIEEGYVFEEDTQLTVLKSSLFFEGDGFCAYDATGNLVFRVDSYGHDVHDGDQLVLMDALGKCLLTVRSKRLSLHKRWEGFAGDRIGGQKPIFSVARSSMMGKCSMTVDVYGDLGEEYQIDGSFSQRCCTLCNSSLETVAEIKRKVDVSTSMALGSDVFTLVVKPGFDATFVMGLVLILDQIDGDDEYNQEYVDPSLLEKPSSQ